MLSNTIYTLSKVLTRPGYLSARKFLKEAAKWDERAIESYQDAMISEIIRIAYTSVPYYRELLQSRGLTPTDFNDVHSLGKLPILEKMTIRERLADFYNLDRRLKFVEGSSGGSTGEPIRYRMSRKNALYSSLLLDRGWGMGGYEPGDKVAIFAGGSLVGRSVTTKKKVIEQLTNIRYFPSYGMNDALFEQYCRELKRFNPKFLRGYASALGALATFVDSRGIASDYRVDAIFSTSEMLADNVRSNLEKVFNCPVYDGWGLNDGGATAFECHEHNGMHVDLERAYIEIVPDDQLVGLPDGVGRIVVTNLIDDVMPFIRYDTGDIGRLDYSPCACGRHTPRLFLKYGRITDRFVVGGRVVGAPVFTVLMGSLPVKQYQVVKKAEDKVVFRVVRDKEYGLQHEGVVIRSMAERLPGVTVLFEYRDQIIPPNGMKHRFLFDDSDSSGINV